MATCEENGLEYVTDKTNFQPEITLRNAIRHMLVEEEGFRIGLTVSCIIFYDLRRADSTIARNHLC